MLQLYEKVFCEIYCWIRLIQYIFILFYFIYLFIILYILYIFYIYYFYHSNIIHTTSKTTNSLLISNYNAV